MQRTLGESEERLLNPFLTQKPCMPTNCRNWRDSWTPHTHTHTRGSLGLMSYRLRCSVSKSPTRALPKTLYPAKPPAKLAETGPPTPADGLPHSLLASHPSFLSPTPHTASVSPPPHHRISSDFPYPHTTSWGQE